ncbi:MAG: hypothetical protein BWZ09_00658 [Alphaproteobacteria bacterium ADurb.BinA305]|nr:MAG: hypothetical protein BWZ09_00658 [Alphaproteobacteria bacterium ADurb.BinA305]
MPQLAIVRQADLVDLVHESAEHRALAAAGRDRAAAELALGVLHAGARGDRDRVGIPVHLHRGDLVQAAHQALVAQPADGERLGGGAERHQGDDLALVDVEREWMLAGDRGRHRVAAFIDRGDLDGEWTAGLAQQGTVGRGHRGGTGDARAGDCSRKSCAAWTAAVWMRARASLAGSPGSQLPQLLQRPSPLRPDTEFATADRDSRGDSRTRGGRTLWERRKSRFPQARRSHCGSDASRDFRKRGGCIVGATRVAIAAPEVRAAGFHARARRGGRLC